MPTPHHDAVVVGGGQAGLATAYYLRKYDVDFVVLDDQNQPGGAWLHAWPSLNLFSATEFSNLPGWMMPHYPGCPPARHVVDYLTRYERRYSLPVERPVRVGVVEYDGNFSLTTTAGTYTADHVVAATGTWSSPFVPYYPGTFSGTQWHSAHYPGPDRFRSSTVAVIGGGNSGAQIAAELSTVAETTWYTRHEPRWMPDDVDGRVLFRRARRRIEVIRRGEPDPGMDTSLGTIVSLPAVREARDRGDLIATPMPQTLDDVHAEHLIWCTGFRPSLAPFRHLMKKNVPNLHLVGYGELTGPGAATLVGVGPFARRAAAEIAGILPTAQKPV